MNLPNTLTLARIGMIPFFIYFLFRGERMYALAVRAWPAGFRVHAAALVRVEPVVAHRLLVLGRDVLDGGGEEVSGGEDLEVALSVPAALGAADDFPRRLVPRDLFPGRRERAAGTLQDGGAPRRREKQRVYLPHRG